MNSKIKLSHGYYKTDRWHPAVFLSFEIVHGTLLRSTREYSLAYVPEIDYWCGDIIACGQWFDLDQNEVNRLRELYKLDNLVANLTPRQVFRS